MTSNIGTVENTVANATKAIQQQTTLIPKFAITLGSGLGGIADAIAPQAVIPYEQIPGFGTSTAAGHRGELILGELAGAPVVAMSGRYHFYEGWTVEETTFPVRVMQALGAAHYIVSNAAGGVGLGIEVGDLLAITDTINAMRGFGFGPMKDLGSESETVDHESNSFQLGSFPNDLFDAKWIDLASKRARQDGWTLKRGTYLGMSGPCYETRAEYRMMRQMGVQAVGMSTVAEAVVARRLGMRVFGLSMISNVANPDRPQVTSHEEVIETGKATADRMQTLVTSLLQHF